MYVPMTIDVQLLVISGICTVDRDQVTPLAESIPRFGFRYNAYWHHDVGFDWQQLRADTVCGAGRITNRSSLNNQIIVHPFHRLQQA